MRQRLPQFDRAKIRRLAGVAIGDLRNELSLVHGGRPGFQAEIQVLHLVEFLNVAHVLGVERPHVLERVVIDKDTMPVLLCSGAISGQGRILPSHQCSGARHLQQIVIILGDVPDG